MKILKIGIFSKDGAPTGWAFDGTGDKPGYALGLDLLFPGSVDVNGIEIVEWTEARKLASKENTTANR